MRWRKERTGDKENTLQELTCLLENKREIIKITIKIICIIMEILRHTFSRWRTKKLSYDEFHGSDSFLQVEMNGESEKQVDSKDINIICSLLWRFNGRAEPVKSPYQKKVTVAILVQVKRNGKVGKKYQLSSFFSPYHSFILKR